MTFVHELLNLSVVYPCTAYQRAHETKNLITRKVALGAAVGYLLVECKLKVASKQILLLQALPQGFRASFHLRKRHRSGLPKKVRPSRCYEPHAGAKDSL